MSQYKTGTVSTTNGSAVVTGSGTSWLASISVGDLFALQASSDPYNVAYEVGSVDSDTQITLTAPFNATVSGNAYVLHRDFHPNGNPKFANGDVETAAILNRWTLGSLQTSDIMTDLSDPASGSLMPPGAFGTGGDLPLITSGDLNNYLTVGETVLVSSAVGNSPSAEVVFVRVFAGSVGGGTPERVTQVAYEYSPSLGVYVRGYTGTWSDWKRIDPQAFGVTDSKPITTDLNDAPSLWSVASTSAANLPAPSAVSFTGGINVLTVKSAGFSSNAYQRVYARQSGNNLIRIYERVFSTVWEPWQEVYTQASILGTVSQSGGVPTGAVIERGSNANGEYVKFADGTLVCWDLVSTGTISGGFTSSPQTFPATFVNSNISVQVTGAEFINSTTFLCHNAENYTAGGFTLVTTAGTTGGSLFVSYIAIGRWF